MHKIGVWDIFVEICTVTRQWAVQPLDWRWWYWWYACMLYYMVYAKGDDFPCMGDISWFMWWYSCVPYRNRLLGIKRYSTDDSTYEHILVGILPKYLILYNKYYGSTDTIVPEELSHWHHCSSVIFQYQLFKPYKPLSFDRI